MLDQLSSLMSPPFPSTRFTIHSTSDNMADFIALINSAPSAVVRGGARTLRTPTNQNRVFVFDRCGRLIYQQPIRESDVNYQSVQAAILSAHQDDPCGPCHLPAQESSRDRQEGLDSEEQPLDQVEGSRRSQSQAKISSIVSQYTVSNIAKTIGSREFDVGNNGQFQDNQQTFKTPGMTHSTVWGTADEHKEDAEEKHSESEKKPERKKNKNKRKKGKQEKYKKRKQVDEELISTAKPMDVDSRKCNCGMLERGEINVETEPRVSSGEETQRCGCDVQMSSGQDRIIDVFPQPVPGDEHPDLGVDAMVNADENLIGLREIVNEILLPQFGSASTTVAPTVTYPHSRIIWPTDKQDFGRKKNRNKKERNMKHNQMDLQHEINEGMAMAKEDEDFVGYPDGIDALIEPEVMVLGEKDVDKNLLWGHEETGYQPNEQVGADLNVEDLDLTFTAVNEQDGESVIGDDQIVIPDDTYLRAGEIDGDQSSKELKEGEDVWGTYEQEETNGKPKNKKEIRSKKVKDTPKKGKKMDGEYKSVGKDEREGREETGMEKDVSENNMSEVKDAWVGNDQMDSQEFVLRWPMELGQNIAEEEGKLADVDSLPWTGGSLFATFKEVTVAPSVYDPTSSSETEDNVRHVVMYEPEEEEPSSEEPISDKLSLLHSKVQPWTKGKH